MTDQEFAIAYLKAVQKKHASYFEESNMNIMKCVRIIGDNLVSVHIINKSLPAEIQYDIEEMFWQH
ncbi:MAG: hypothetical protein JWQ34_3749 [Mucilaginibacter sp.]|uniref:hypothetical protein n=1 Tax=Mucilaginibacter sp. TaxID=1882438 RepID=UPI00260B86D2|nr:hypothetical protein [Mucilaginibacter sp.]MDB5005524.1 hypothetical protein [Mucilaginibacter sp.]